MELINDEGSTHQTCYRIGWLFDTMPFRQSRNRYSVIVLSIQIGYHIPIMDRPYPSLTTHRLLINPPIKIVKEPGKQENLGKINDGPAPSEQQDMKIRQPLPDFQSSPSDKDDTEMEAKVKTHKVETSTGVYNMVSRKSLIIATLQKIIVQSLDHSPLSRTRLT